MQEDKHRRDRTLGNLTPSSVLAVLLYFVITVTSAQDYKQENIHRANCVINNQNCSLFIGIFNLSDGLVVKVLG